MKVVLMIAATAVLLPGVAMVPAAARSASNYSITIRLQVTGRYRSSGTFSQSSKVRNGGCAVAPHGYLPKPLDYTVRYHRDVFLTVPPLPVNALELTIYPYKPGVTRYAGASHELDLLLGTHYLLGGGPYFQTHPRFRISITLSANGLRGQFRATSVEIKQGKTFFSMKDDPYTVTVVGTWSCNALARS